MYSGIILRTFNLFLSKQIPLNCNLIVIFQFLAVYREIGCQVILHHTEGKILKLMKQNHKTHILPLLLNKSNAHITKINNVGKP